MDSISIFVPELLTDVEGYKRSITDWYEESLSEELSYGDVEAFIHEDALPKIPEKPVRYEAIGEYSISCSKDYYGEYDEESAFIVTDWNISPDTEPKDFVF